jgi:3'-5' exonuclease
MVPAPAVRKVGRGSDVTINPLTTMSTMLGDRECIYSGYAGQILEGLWIAFDTETSLIEDHKIPDLALVSVSDGGEHRLIHPDQVGHFLLAHAERYLIFHNVAFDFWVIAEHLKRRGEDKALEAWWGFADGDRMRDTMIQDQLIRLARHDTHPRPRNLAEVAMEYAGLAVDKSDPYRLRYAEIIGADWSTVDPGFFNYAIKDPIVTWAAYQAMVGESIDLMEAHGYDSSRRP